MMSVWRKSPGVHWAASVVVVMFVQCCYQSAIRPRLFVIDSRCTAKPFGLFSNFPDSGYLLSVPALLNPWAHFALFCSALAAPYASITLNPQLFITDTTSNLSTRCCSSFQLPHLIILSSSSFKHEEISIAQAGPPPNPRHLAISQTPQISPQPRQGLPRAPSPCYSKGRHQRDQQEVAQGLCSSPRLLRPHPFSSLPARGVQRRRPVHFLG